MRRVEGWESRLATVFAEWREKPFQWGESDCLMWVAAVGLAITGEDFGSKYRGRYKTPRGAFRKLRKTPEAHLDSLCDRCVEGHARRGDLALIPQPEDRFFKGVCAVVGMNGRTLWTPTESGLVQRPMSDGEVFWRVG